MKKIKFIIIILIFDLIISNLLFKNLPYWNVIEWEKKYWRISSEVYHHGILSNIDFYDPQLTKRIITNSIGFIDKKIELC